MSAKNLGNIIDVGLDILNTVLDATTGSILMQLGNVIAQTVDSDNVASWQHVGFLSRAPNPVAGQAAAQAIIFRQSGGDVTVAERDLRGQKLAATLGPGETVLYAAGPAGTSQGRVMLKGDGTVAFYTAQGNAEGGASCVVQLAPDGSIYLTSPLGGITLTSDGIGLACGSAAIRLKTSGDIDIMGTSINLNGQQVAIGAGATPATPAVVGPVGVSGIGSTSVFIAP